MTGDREAEKIMTKTEIEKWSKKADQILRSAGFKPNGRPQAEKSQSIKTVSSVPMGGSNVYRLHMRRP